MTNADGDQPPHGAEAVEQGSDDPGDENASTRRNPNGHHATNARGGASEEARVPRCLKEGCSCCWGCEVDAGDGSQDDDGDGDLDVPWDDEGGKTPRSRKSASMTPLSGVDAGGRRTTLKMTRMA